MSRSDGKAEEARRREQRLAEKLRENLRRRKAQVKARDTVPEERSVRLYTGDPPGGDGDSD